MFELPLFPLNTVLFPGMPISLHIFEPRYKEMIERCITDHQPFGVVLIREGKEALGPLAEPYPIGCTAIITQIEHLEDGRMNIVAVGHERFQIRALTYDRPYLVGTVENFPFETSERPDKLTEASQRFRPWIEKYLSVLTQLAEDVEFDPSQLPHDPVALAYLGAALVQIPPVQKQDLLSASQVSELLNSMVTIYRREVALLDSMIAQNAGSTGMFSHN